MKAEIIEKSIEIIFKKGSKTSLKNDILKALDYAMEAYANQKVLEALRKETPKAYDKGNNDVSRWHNAKTVGKKYYKTEVEPKYK